MPASLPFDPAGLHFVSGRGLVRQLYQQLRERILDGRLGAGVRLPASRDLAHTLSISRNSVMRAYEQLLAEGFAEARVGDGTYIAFSRIEPAKPQLRRSPSTGLSTAFEGGLPTALSTGSSVNPSSVSHPTPALARALAHGMTRPTAGAPRAFQVGLPAFDLFPFDVWSKLYSAFWRSPNLAALGYQDPAGDPSLREMVAAYLRISRGLPCDADQIVITCGAQQGISLCAQLLLQPGDLAAVENPGYRAAGHALASAGARLVGIGVDQDGLRCNELPHGEDCRVVYVTPAHQYPTGVTMSLARRLQLLEWAQRSGAWIIEDDYDGEYRYSGAPLAPLAALDSAGRVLYVGTFGKVAFPALRLGYLVLPKALASAFARRRAVDMRHSEVASQWVMAQFMARGHFQRHIRRMRKAALSRRDALLGAWPQHVEGCAHMPVVSAGLHVKVDVATAGREAELVRLAQQVAVDIQPLTSYWLETSATPVDNRAGLVLGFAGVNETAIVDAVARLCDAWC
ncbi:PLP-dependent aminotransferase family protein [Pseudomonas sp. RIT-PI-S]|uniref:MocR-like pyridoxine biosynthesis transcription factor PdxR n=1 Tax=Pseudomonas sp. RIT-PI-S TaxID=3035295 RepID=UPI0021D97100|nr:PLP-dependent aminotransferase family protein [Pseudomonas sp. RIT-PI-S]